MSTSFYIVIKLPFLYSELRETYARRALYFLRSTIWSGLILFRGTYFIVGVDGKNLGFVTLVLLFEDFIRSLIC